ncbi:MAG: signal peptidase II [Candidatus Gracilibacteria bacterium]|nr:signal peptidase II [Candidatus Gracilibacteria bacterium]MDD2908341.1 signal peptidase II [Candidatus Gracilibacteria bacterium]
MSQLSNEINIVGDFLRLQLIYNKGIAFSIPISGIILKILTVAIISGITVYYYKNERKRKNNILDIGYGLILGGAIGNGIERIINSKVTDFIAIKYFAIFNFGDIFINIGVIILLIYYFKTGQNNKI